ncbi:hypothetical protein L1987_28606 [Smallanthus sonchifolius]|uniref:Uncharacterized protein n=1 Tax=Smallanthus sonchifolius TaxID=185202 RepID=A0ACB9HZ49_9ASTR|nr:hypothetical protein L1987_28606 [Smallanthus sonchifolius]
MAIVRNDLFSRPQVFASSLPFPIFLRCYVSCNLKLFVIYTLVKEYIAIYIRFSDGLTLLIAEVVLDPLTA